ncbi:unnamed protein product, partial [Choristocarpus tenellus]
VLLFSPPPPELRFKTIEHLFNAYVNVPSDDVFLPVLPELPGLTDLGDKGESLSGNCKNMGSENVFEECQAQNNVLESIHNKDCKTVRLARHPQRVQELRLTWVFNEESEMLMFPVKGKWLSWVWEVR